MKNITILLSLALLSLSCKKSAGEDYSVFEGKLSKHDIASLVGFEEQREAILAAEKVSLAEFKSISTDSAWSLPVDKRNSLKAVCQAIEMPSEGSLLQKVIALDDLATYMNNVYGGTVGGFVSVASDMKHVGTMYDTYWGLRLDYEGTKFRADGAGYAVIRFYSDATSNIVIPFCSEMGGTQPHSWPNTGGGFTASSLGSGGYPEYVFKSYSAPRDGAELYEVTPQGREILRSVFVKDKGWQTNEIGSPMPVARSLDVRNGVYATKAGKVLITTYALFGGDRYIVRGKIGDQYHLTTQIPYEGVRLEVVEKGIYGIKVSVSEVEKIWEISEKID